LNLKRGLDMTAKEVLDYYLNNPPFEIADETKWQTIMNQALQTTLIELSENDPIIEEKEFHTPKSEDENSDYVLVDIYETIDPNLMDFIILSPKDRLHSLYPSVILSGIVNYFGSFSGLSYSDIVAVQDGIEALRSITQRYIQKIIFGGRKIKLLQDTDYYTMYYRYRNIDEITPDMMRYFTQLFEVNLFLNAYKSDVFAEEQGVRSVSLSGLSVSLNVPNTESIQKTLEQKKNQILSEIALTDYDGLIGHW
jgi:hypothetical protein